MAFQPPIPETRVLAIASHVVHGYVGNKMASFVMQALGCDVSAINTVNYSNHTAYRRVAGTKTSAAEIASLYSGLKSAGLNDFDVLLTGYIPSAEGVLEVGKIARDLKWNASTKPGSFFWVLDPVMGDEGKLYIPEDEVPAYKALLREADLILPNQFEAELLSDTKITDLASLAEAVQVLHKKYQVPHVIITSLHLDDDGHTLTPTKDPSSERNSASSHPSTWTSEPPEPSYDPATSHPSTWTTPKPSSSKSKAKNLTIIGSTSTSTHTPRLFRITTPHLPLFFSGTGDMFAALMVPRLIEAINNLPQSTTPLSSTTSWKSPDDVAPEDLPLAKAVQKVLASMQAILNSTAEKCKEAMQKYDERAAKDGRGSGPEAEIDAATKRHLKLMKESEVRVVRYVKDIVEPSGLEKFVARRVDEGGEVDGNVGMEEEDGLGVTQVGLGNLREGAVVLGGDGGWEIGGAWGKEEKDKGMGKEEDGKAGQKAEVEDEVQEEKGDEKAGEEKETKDEKNVDDKKENKVPHQENKGEVEDGGKQPELKDKNERGEQRKAVEEKDEKGMSDDGK